MDLEVGNILVEYDGEYEITSLNKVSEVNYIYVSSKCVATGREQPSKRISKKSDVSIKSREVIKMLALQNAIEGTRKLVEALLQMLDIANLDADADGKVSLQNSNIKVAKEVLSRGARDEMQVAKSQLNELVKKL